MSFLLSLITAFSFSSGITGLLTVERMCSCRAQPLEEHIEESSVIISGTVIAEIQAAPVRDSAHGTWDESWLTRFKVVRQNVYKGKVPDTVTVVTAKHSAACGYRFLIGQPYLIYGDVNSQGELSTSICTSTKPLSSADEDLTFFEKMGIRAR